LLAVWALLGGTVLSRLFYLDKNGIFAERNFYGPLQVSLGRIPSGRKEFIQLRNGTIMHGREFTARGHGCEPLTYYARESGLGLALRQKGASGPIRVGVIGLGAGPIAGYAHPGDAYRFYEINPLVRYVATREFHYLRCAPNPSIVIGDGRLSLE